MKVGVSPGPREKICIMRNQSGSLKGKKGQKWTGKVIFYVLDKENTWFGS